MNGMESVVKLFHWLSASCIALLIVIAAIVYCSDDAMLHVYERMILWNALALVTFLVTMVTPSFRKGITGEGRTVRDYAVLVFLFAITSMMCMQAFRTESGGMMSNFCFIIPLFVSLVGGTRIGLIAALVSSVVQFALLGSAPISIVSALVLYISALVAGLWPKKSDRSTDHTLYLLPIAVVGLSTIVIFLLSPMLPFSQPYDIGAIFLHATVPMAFAGLITIVGYEYILRAVSVIADYTRRKSDLQIAHNIQMSAVPMDFPKTGSMSICSVMEPAVEVGGDFYDVFQIRKGLYGFVIADVSGKGLPASLFMMRAQATIRANAMTGLPPHEVMRRSNIELCQRNDVGQFVTVWVGMLDLDTHTLRYSNAGHTLPYMVAEGGAVPMEQPRGLVMGYSPKAKYSTVTVRLDKGESVFLYTDGVNEAFDSNQEQFGAERIVSALSASDGRPDSIVSEVREAVRGFVGDAPVSDDITMLSFRVDPGNIARFEFESKVDNVGEAVDAVHEHLVSSGCPEREALKLDIVTEEIFVNICHYAYGGEAGMAEVYAGFSDGVASLTFVDSGTAFDPTGREEVILDEDVSKWPIGGLGIHMSLKLTDSAHYKRIMGMNVFTLKKKVLPGEGAVGED